MYETKTVGLIICITVVSFEDKSPWEDPGILQGGGGSGSSKRSVEIFKLTSKKPLRGVGSRNSSKGFRGPRKGRSRSVGIFKPTSNKKTLRGVNPPPPDSPLLQSIVQSLEGFGYNTSGKSRILSLVLFSSTKPFRIGTLSVNETPRCLLQCPERGKV